MFNPLIAKLERLGPLSEDDRRALASAADRIKVLGPRETLIEEGAAVDHVFLIVSGWAYRHKTLPDGRRQIMALLTAGDMCCVQALFSGSIDHTIGTLAASRVAMVPRSEFLALTDERPQVTRALWRASLIDMAILREWVVRLGQRSADERMAHLLSELLLRLEAIGLVQNDGFELPVTQTELAEVLGLSSVHVNRVLQSMRREGLISLQGGWVTVHDRGRLEALASFDPGYLRA